MSTWVSIDNGFPGDGSLKFYVSPPALGLDLERDLQDAGVETVRLLEFSDTARDVMVFAVAFTGGGGVKHLAQLLDSFFHRNDGKEIALRTDGEISVKGLTVEQVEQVLKARVERQDIVDENWRRSTSGTPSVDSGAASDESPADPRTDPS